MADAFETGRIAATEAQIVAYDAAITALAGGRKEYLLDTGQTRQRVTLQDLDQLRQAVKSLYELRAILLARTSGGGAQGVPGW